jgi:Transposase IS116/IS110/IS902 family
LDIYIAIMTESDAVVLPVVARLDAIPGVSAELAAAIIAETGLDVSRFPTAGHLVSWAGLCPRAVQSGPRNRHGKGQGNTYLRGCLGQAATGATGTDTFLGERHARIARRRGGGRARVATARSILVIIWHLLADPQARNTDLGPGYYQTKIDTNRKARNHIRQLEALGFQVTITQAAQPAATPPASHQGQLRRRCRAPRRGGLFSGQRRRSSSSGAVCSRTSAARASRPGPGSTGRAWRRHGEGSPCERRASN